MICCIPIFYWQGRHQKFRITTFPTKLLHDVNNCILKYLCKFQVDIPINARVIAVQSLIENSLTSLPHNSVFDDSNNFKFGTEKRFMVKIWAN